MMADEEQSSRNLSRMDLNLYLGLPRSPRPRSLDIGSDLALNSVPSSSVEESESPVVMPSAAEPTEPQPSEFRLNPEYTPDLPATLMVDSLRSNEYTPYFPAYEPPYRISFVPVLRTVSEMNSSSLPSPALREFQETMAELVVESHMSYHSGTLASLAAETVSYSPPFVSGSGIPMDEEGADVSLYAEQLGDLMTAEDMPHLSPEPIRRLHSQFIRSFEIASSSGQPSGRIRSSVAYAGEQPSSHPPLLPNSGQVAHGASSPARDCETNASNKVFDNDNVVEGSKEKRDEKDKTAVYFECNICFDTATEPVVTSCGHLFCWPCLFQWLHIHSDYKECPVCKGEVTEGNITPIYGRGNSSTETEKSEDPESSVKIPPRPRGSRLESFRQQFQPVARRFNDGIAPWRRLIGYMRNRHRYGPIADPAQPDDLDNDHHTTASRLRARRLHRHLNSQNAAENGELGLPPSTGNIQNPASTTSSIFQDLWEPVSLDTIGPERLAAIAADFGRMYGHIGNNSDRFGASTSAAEPSILELPGNEQFVPASMAADQISASSTMAVIQGDNATSNAIPDPNSAGTSRSHRRRGRSSSSGSFEITYKRRLN